MGLSCPRPTANHSYSGTTGYLRPPLRSPAITLQGEVMSGARPFVVVDVKKAKVSATARSRPGDSQCIHMAAVTPSG